MLGSLCINLVGLFGTICRINIFLSVLGKYGYAVVMWNIIAADVLVVVGVIDGVKLLDVVFVLDDRDKSVLFSEVVEMVGMDKIGWSDLGGGVNGSLCIPFGKNVLGGGVIESLWDGVFDGDGSVSCFNSSDSDSLINCLLSIW